MAVDTPLFGLRGYLIDAPQPGELRSWSDGAIVVDEGLIAEVGDYSALRVKPRDQPVKWTHSNCVAVFPGLVDAHTHLPQYPAVARGQTKLLPWLKQLIFPIEKQFTGSKGRQEASWFFRELARHGTTTAAIYTAIFKDTCNAAFEAAEKLGLRAIIGTVMMDQQSYGPHEPRRMLSISLHESETLCQKWHGANDGLLEYAFGPRFAISCSEELMRGAGDLASRYSAYVQTHLSESTREVEQVRKLFPGARDYLDVYDRCGLLGRKTILGHSIHLSARERDRLAETGSAVAHCPTANLFLSSGIMELDDYRRRGIRVGLGSDVAAGPELNLWRVMRSAIESQKARSFYVENVKAPTPADVLHLATQGGAEALSKGETIGSFDIGKEADFIVMDIASMLPYRHDPRALDDMSAEDILSLCIYRGGPEAVVETFVRGRSVHRSLEPKVL